MNKFKTIVWDVDDVLYPFSAFIPEINSLENKMSKEDYLDILDEFRLNTQLDSEPFHDVLNWFKKYGGQYRHIAITACPLHLIPLSSTWVFTFFRKWIRTISIIPSKRKYYSCIVYDESKLDFIKNNNINCDLFIDDNINTINEMEKAGYKTLLFPTPMNNNNLSIKTTLKKIKEIIEG